MTVPSISRQVRVIQRASANATLEVFEIIDDPTPNRVSGSWGRYGER